MPATRFALPTARFGFDGYVLLQQFNTDSATASAVWAFPTASYSLNKSDNVYRPQTADANSNMHFESKGLRVGSFEFAAPLVLDRGAIDFINAANGISTRKYPFQATILPFSGAAPQNAGNVFFRQVRLACQTSVDGRSSMVLIQGTAYVCDPDNAQGLASLAAPATLGNSGAGITNFMRCSLLDQAATPNDYRMTSFILTLDNNMTVSPTRVPGFALSEGCIPGQAMGSFSAAQDKNAANVLPATGRAVFTLNLPTGDLSHVATATINTSFDDESLNVAPDQLVRAGRNAALFNPANGSNLVTWAYA